MRLTKPFQDSMVPSVTGSPAWQANTLCFCQKGEGANKAALHEPLFRHHLTMLASARLPSSAAYAVSNAMCMSGDDV